MAVRNNFQPGEVLLSADMNDTFGSKLDIAGGKILQIVRATDSTVRSTTSTSYVDATGMSVTITPQKNNSAIILIAACLVGANSSTDQTESRYQIADASDNATSGTEGLFVGTNNLTGTGTRNFRQYLTLIGYATPATTDPTTYKLRFRAGVSTTTALVFNADATGQMYAIEVSA
jgi:hypothetical protein